MDITGFEKIAPHLANPLVLAGFGLLLAYGIHWQLMKSGLLSKVDKKDSGIIIRLFLRYGFWLALILLLAGFALPAWNKYMDTVEVISIDAQKTAENLLKGQLDKKDEQIKALTEAITALSKTGGPAASINAALQELKQGNTAKAQAIFAEVLKTKEAEGKQANKEAAAAARHLGALACMNDTKAALAAYRKATELDPDNAAGWNMLGLLLRRIGEFTQAEQMHKKAIEINNHFECKEGSACASINLGNVYLSRGEIDKAEQLYKAALEISQPLGDKEGLAQAYGNLGHVYFVRHETDMAEKMHRKAIEIYESLGSKDGMAHDYAGLGIVSLVRGELNKAEELLIHALEISKELNSNKDMANIYSGLGLVHERRGDLDKAEEMYKKSLEISEVLGLKEITANQYTNLGRLYKQRGNLDQAEEMWKKSLSLFQAMGHPNAKKVQQWLDELAQKKAASSQ